MNNRELKSLQSLWLHLASNQRYRKYLKDSDIETFKERSSNEGLPFLTQGLPLFGKALDRFHSTHNWVWKNSEVSFFKLQKSHIKIWVNPAFVLDESIEIPIFLSSAIEAALARDPSAVDCVRQLSYLFYKLEVPHEESVKERYLDQFVTTDSDVGTFWHSSPSPNRLGLVKAMKGLIGRILCNSDPTDIIPSHGSGETACRTPNYEKYHKLRYYEKLDEIFSYSEYFFVSPTHLVDEMEKLEESRHEDPTARVALVPKDSRGPRIISCEPAELMYIQQGLMRKLYDTIEHHTITRGLINFRDQTINRFLAHAGSLYDQLCTIDLSDASDRVSLQLVKEVFPPRWVEALEASRSENTRLPNGKIVKLNKFAPMGSSCCFPVEALVFWACAEATLRLTYGRTHGHQVFVYGDDIITSSNVAEDVIQGLESIGLLVNRDKSFVKGPFRESCGGDYYLGVDVTPVRLKKSFGSSDTSLPSTADFCNLLIAKFGYTAAYPAIDSIESYLGYIYPRTLLDIPCTIRSTSSAVNDVYFRRRWNKNLQRYEHHIPQVVNKVKQRQSPNWGELLRKLLTCGIGEASDLYCNQVARQDRSLRPGLYADPHSVVRKWVWAWLG
jgi:hypothetical protein